MNDFDAKQFVAYVSDRLGVPLSTEELEHAAERAVLKRAELEPMYSTGTDAPIDGVQTFTPR